MGFAGVSRPVGSRAYPLLDSPPGEPTRARGVSVDRILSPVKEDTMRGKSLLFAVFIVAALIVSVACRPSQTLERQTGDAGIKTKIKAKLASDVGASTITAVEVNVTNGVVTLAGPVSSA